MLQAYFWLTADRMDLLEQMPTIEARRQAMSQVAVVSRQYGSTTLSYVGRANMGGAERYVRELREQGITWEITGRHPMEIASIADL